jgi:pyruvate dehydrogenase E1 component alpha subunit
VSNLFPLVGGGIIDRSAVAVPRKGALLSRPKGVVFEIPPRVQILDEEGRLKSGTAPLPDEETRRLYRHMVRSRLFDDRLLKLQRQGRIGTFAPSAGQEACQVGSLAALTERDWFVPAFREMTGALYRGATMKSVLIYTMGYEEGSVVPEGARDLPVSIPVGGQAAHAMGIAWAMKLKKDPGIVITYFGEGASSEGIVYEAMNFAGVLRVPVIFFCQNNQWAISTPRRLQTAAETIAQKAVAAGIQAVQIDGNDLFAVHQATKEAAALARQTGMSTLIEGITFRKGVHTTADDPSVYRTKAEEEAWAKRDPIDRVRKYLTAKGAWSDAAQTKLEEEINAEIQVAIEDAEAFRAAGPSPLQMFDHTFSYMPPYLQRQRDEAEAAFEGRDVMVGVSTKKQGAGSQAVVGELEEARD